METRRPISILLCVFLVVSYVENKSFGVDEHALFGSHGVSMEDKLQDWSNDYHKRFGTGDGELGERHYRWLNWKDFMKRDFGDADIKSFLNNRWKFAKFEDNSFRKRSDE